MRRWAAIAIAVITGLALTACGSGGPGGDGGATNGQGRLEVVATTSILGDITRHILGAAGTVRVLLPPGTDPHTFQPSAKQAAMLRQADVVVANGLRLVPGLVDPLQAAEDSGVDVLRVAEHVHPIPFEGAPAHEHSKHDHGHGHGHSHDHQHGRLDPHVWLDPVRMAEAARLIGRHIAAAAPDASETIRGNANNYAAQVMAMHHTVRQILDAVPQENRKLVTNHDSFGYFAKRYDFEVIGTVLPGSSTLSEASGGHISELVATIKHAGVSAIFAETTAPIRLAKTVSRELGGKVTVVRLHTGALAKQGPASTYLGMMKTNARRIAKALTT